MVKRRSHLSILLLQIRDDAVTCQEELAEFVRYSQLDATQFSVLNTFETPEFEPGCIESYDALFVGGSSDASVTQPNRYPFVEPTKQLLVHCVKERIPVFASCFGFQAAVEALGGQVVVDKDAMEMGTYSLQLTPAAATDALLYDVPNRFWAVSGHQERAVSMPVDSILLAFSDRCPYHAFKMANAPFYGFQFHPEVDPQDLTARITRYQARYLDSTDALSEILRTLQVETPVANRLIAKFVDRILLTSP